MDNLENKPLEPAPRYSSAPGLQEQLDALQRTVVIALVLMIILSGALNLFLLRQVKFSRTDLANTKPQATALINDYTKAMPMMNEFVNRVREYGRTHPDYMPILVKYGVVTTGTNQAPGVLSPVPKPAAPVPTVPAKK